MRRRYPGSPRKTESMLRIMRVWCLVFALAGLAIGPVQFAHAGQAAGTGPSVSGHHSGGHLHGAVADEPADEDMSSIACALFVCLTAGTGLAPTDTAAPVRYETGAFAYFYTVVPLQGHSPEREPPVPRTGLPTAI